jgi:hypothetical protein
MSTVWGSMWSQRNWWKVGILATCGWTCFYIAIIAPYQERRRVSMQRATGLAAVSWDPVSMMRRPSWEDFWQPSPPQTSALMATYAPLMNNPGEESDVQRARREDHKVLRSAALELEVKNPAECMEKIRALADHLGGFLEKSQLTSDPYSNGGAITIRVPVSSFEEARVEIRKLAVRIANDTTEAIDVTRDYVDKEARLRNLRAAESQYLAILKRASTVKDTLEASTKLNEVRGEIEQQQAEFTVLARQVETVVIAVSLHSEADAQVFGIRWRPLYEIRVAARSGLENLGGYAAVITLVIFSLPTIALWLITAAITWRVMRWVWKKLFFSSKPKPA